LLDLPNQASSTLVLNEKTQLCDHVIFCTMYGIDSRLSSKKTGVSQVFFLSLQGWHSIISSVDSIVPEP
jgi:hypothetical protein